MHSYPLFCPEVLASTSGGIHRTDGVSTREEGNLREWVAQTRLRGCGSSSQAEGHATVQPSTGGKSNENRVCVVKGRDTGAGDTGFDGSGFSLSLA